MILLLVSTELEFKSLRFYALSYGFLAMVLVLGFTIFF